jgi:hypothetical protein
MHGEHDLTERGSGHALHGGIGFGPRGGRAQLHHQSDGHDLTAIKRCSPLNH